ncbi:hypothetical protein Bbelb_043660 [Branchiostoma belcheri]|nr:hypothetical protein Bbelb_043660 [Branchiostoma belcheri]
MSPKDLDRKHYDRKVQDLLGGKDTYMPLNKDPTNRFKGKISATLKKLETEGILDRATYLKLNPTTEQPPAFHGLPKIHKQGVPSTTHVSSIGSVTFVGQELFQYLSATKPTRLAYLTTEKETGTTGADLDRKHYDRKVQDLLEGKDTYMPLNKDPTNRFKGKISATLKKLETEGILDRQFYQQMHGCAMGSPVSPIVVNLYVEKLENIALSTFNDTPQLTGFDM